MNEKILAAIEEVIARREFSIAAARDLETLIAEAGEQAIELQDLLDILASYQPGGGEFLYDSNDLLRELQRLVSAARQQSHDEERLPRRR